MGLPMNIEVPQKMICITTGYDLAVLSPYLPFAINATYQSTL